VGIVAEEGPACERFWQRKTPQDSILA
jgi:hypothetical protein